MFHAPIRSRYQASARPVACGTRVRLLVTEVREKVSGDALEAGRVLGAHLASPVADAFRRRLEQPLVVRLRGDVDGAGVFEHGRLERQRGEVADRADDALCIGDEVLVANLVVARLAGFAPECLRAANLRPPLAGEAGGAARMRPRLRDHAGRHVEERERGVAPVADEVHVLGVRE